MMLTMRVECIGSLLTKYALCSKNAKQISGVLKVYEYAKLVWGEAHLGVAVENACEKTFS